MRAPVGFLIFNRPDQTRRVFAQIAKAKPPKLLIVADGPRQTVAGEAERCAAARAVVERIDWDCDVFRNYADANMGCKGRVASGLTWIFDQVEEAVILEDDTLPHPTFFRFCEELLEKYRDDERVMHVSGNNYQFGRRAGPYSYYFSRYDHIWGWASWRRAWRHYDVEMKLWPSLRETAWLLDILGNDAEAQWWRENLDRVSTSRIDTWDSQWLFSIWRQSGLSITPNVNLVANIGFGSDSTHTREDQSLSSLTQEPIIFPLRHPPGMAHDADADRFAFEVACRLTNPQQQPPRFSAVRRKLSSLFS